MTLFISMSLFALVTSISPGPVNILAFMSGAKSSSIRNIWFVLGATIGFCSIFILVGLGLGKILQIDSPWTRLLSVFGSIYLLYIAYILVRAKVDLTLKTPQEVVVPTFIQGVLLQYTNPKAWMVSMSGLAMFLAHTQHYFKDLVYFASIFFVICFLSIFSWVFLGNIFSKYFSNNAVSVFNKAMALLLALLVLIDLYRTF